MPSLGHVESTSLGGAGSTATSELVQCRPKAGRGRPVARALSGKDGHCPGLAPPASMFSRSPILQGALALIPHSR